MRTVLNIGALVVVLDQATKFLAIQFLKPISQLQIIPDIFHLTYVENTGIAFGMFQDQPLVWTIIITVSVVILLFAAPFFSKQAFSRRIAYGFILGGAVGNWIDRLRLHNVIDFLDFRVWPVFNIADSFICIGVVIFVWFALRGQ